VTEDMITMRRTAEKPFDLLISIWGWLNT